MSRKGRVPIALPKGVEARVSGDVITVKGPKGVLTQKLVPGVLVQIQDGMMQVAVEGHAPRDQRRLQGLFRALLQNLVTGTVTGFETKLELVGVGYRASVQGNEVDLQLGFSHPVRLKIPDGLHIKVEKSILTVSGMNKQQVGQFGAQIRRWRKPEPYQGKGIRYEGEIVRKKAGKAAKTAAKA